MAASGCRYADAAARLEAMAALEARLGQREEELGRVSASKEKLAAMVASLQAALHAMGAGGGRTLVHHTCATCA